MYISYLRTVDDLLVVTAITVNSSNLLLHFVYME